MNEEKTEATTTEEAKFRLRTIVSDQDAITLREVSKPVAFTYGDNSGAAFLDKDTAELIQALKDYVVENDGLGMAAIQLGVAKRVFVMRQPFNGNRIVTIINPQIIRGNGSRIKGEGCFSVPNLPDSIGGVLVKRMTTIFVNYDDEKGERQTEEMFVGMDARIFQHELDHLNGITMLDDTRFKGWDRT